MESASLMTHILNSSPGGNMFFFFVFTMDKRKRYEWYKMSSHSSDLFTNLFFSNCIHLECLALNFCLHVKGSALKTLIQRCKKLKTLLLHHCGEKCLNQHFVVHAIRPGPLFTWFDLLATQFCILLTKTSHQRLRVHFNKELKYSNIYSEALFINFFSFFYFGHLNVCTAHLKLLVTGRMSQQLPNLTPSQCFLYHNQICIICICEDSWSFSWSVFLFGTLLFSFPICCSGLDDKYMRDVEWEQSKIYELDLTSTELSEETLRDVLGRINGFSWLGLGHCEFFTDKVFRVLGLFIVNRPNLVKIPGYKHLNLILLLLQILEELSRKGKLNNIKAIDISHTVSLSENAIFNFIRKHGAKLEALMIAGKPKLAEQFFLNVIPFMLKIKYVWVITYFNCHFSREGVTYLCYCVARPVGWLSVCRQLSPPPPSYITYFF